MRAAGGLIVRPDLRFDLEYGWGRQPVFGERRAIPNNSTVDIWGGDADTRPLPLAAKPMWIVSDSADDAFGGAGANLAYVSFIDEFGDWRNSDLLVMAGLTKVPITYKPSDGINGNAANPAKEPTPPDGSSVIADVFRVQDALIVVAGPATEALPKVTNIGVVDVVDALDVVFERIPATAGRSRSAAFHCPRNHMARLVDAPVATFGGQLEGFIAATFGLGTAWQKVPIIAVDSSAALFKVDPALTPISPRADIQGVVRTQSNQVTVTFLMQFRISPI